jgi:uncharacterized membrane protein YiaA
MLTCRSSIIAIHRHLSNKHGFKDVHILCTLYGYILTNRIESHRSGVHLEVLSWQRQQLYLLFSIEILQVVVLDDTIDLKQDVVKQPWIHNEFLTGILVIFK